MKINGLSASITPIQSGPIIQPQAVSDPPEGEPELTVGEEGSGKANGVVSKLNEGGHFKGVADVRLRISHFDNPDLEKIDPDLLPDTEDVHGKAYEKFLAQYRALYEASQVTAETVVPEPDPDLVTTVEPLSESDVPAIEIPETDIIEEPVVETPPVIVEEPVIVTPIEIEPVAVPELTETEAPVDEVDGALAAFEKILESQASEGEPETLDIVM